MKELVRKGEHSQAHLTSASNASLSNITPTAVQGSQQYKGDIILKLSKVLIFVFFLFCLNLGFCHSVLHGVSPHESQRFFFLFLKLLERLH